MLLYLFFVILYSVSASRYALRHDTTLDYIVEELRNLKSKQATCDVKASAMEELISQLQQRNEYLEKRNDNLEKRIDNLDKRNDNLDKRNDNLEKRNDNLETEVNRLGQILQQGEKYNQTRNPKQIAQTINQPHIVTKRDTDKLAPNVRNKRHVAGQIAFTVGVSVADIEHLGDHHTIVFDKGVTNIGNAYNTNTGIFSVPLKGAYVFTLTLMVIARHSEFLELAVDGRTVALDILADASSVDDYISSTKQWILDLKQGSQVWIRTASYGNSGEVHGYMHTVLNCFLLFETE